VNIFDGDEVEINLTMLGSALEREMTLWSFKDKVVTEGVGHVLHLAAVVIHVEVTLDDGQGIVP
jgi:hypothetical protein